MYCNFIKWISNPFLWAHSLLYIPHNKRLVISCQASNLLYKFWLNSAIKTPCLRTCRVAWTSVVRYELIAILFNQSFSNKRNCGKLKESTDLYSANKVSFVDSHPGFECKLRTKCLYNNMSYKTFYIQNELC